MNPASCFLDLKVRSQPDRRTFLIREKTGVGKSRTINNILQTSMASVTPDVYKLLTCWYWHSFQSEVSADHVRSLIARALIDILPQWVEEEIISWTEDEFEVNEGSEKQTIEWGGADLPKQPRPQGYIVPEGKRILK